MSHAGVRTDRRGRRARLEPIVITALFDDRAAVDEAQRRLYEAGLPRDLIEVVVSRDAASRFYGGLVRSPGREVFRYAGIGGLVGLVLAALLSFVILALPGEEPPGAVAIVQLLGPNIGTVSGALIGAIYGAFHCRRPSARHDRAAEDASAILLVVRSRADADIPTLTRLIAESGGRDIHIEE